MTKKEQKQLIIGVIAAAAAGVAYLAFRGPRVKTIYDWNETMNVAQGHPFTIKLPRGNYSVSSPDLFLQAQLHLGTETQIVMIAPAITDEEYTIKAVLVDEDRGDPYPIEIIARPASAYGDVPTRNHHPVMHGVSRADRRSALIGGQA